MTFQEFVVAYVAEQKRRHHDNSYWQTDEQVIENLGGIDALRDIFSLANMVSEDAQKKLLGFVL